MRNNILVIFCIIFFTSMLLSACQPVPSAVFSNQCVAPCWRQITPGVTKFQDAVNLIYKFQDLDPKNNAVWQPKSFYSDIIRFHLTNGDDITIFAINSIVALTTFHNPPGIVFDDCINEFGQPEYVTQFSVLGAGSSFFPSDARHILFYALTPKKGVAYGYDTQNIFNLSANTKISDIKYFDVKLYDLLYQNNSILAFDPFGEIPTSKLHTWNGYGDITTLYP